MSGIAMGFNAPGFGTHLIGLIAYFPFLLVLERIHQCPISLAAKISRTFLACWLMGFWGAVIGTHWMIYCIHVFGHLSWPVAVLITGFGYGLEVALVLFSCFGLPMFLIKRWCWWDIPLRLSYFLVVDQFYPRLFRWTFGGLTFSEVPWLSQVADIIGESGLGLFSIGFNFVILLLWRWKIVHSVEPRIVRRLCIASLVLLSLGLGYGAWRSAKLTERLNRGPRLHIAAIQPNFSLKFLASNPALTYSERLGNIDELIDDSILALQRFPSTSPISRLVVWPESTYPFAYFKNAEGRKTVKRFARHHKAAVLFQSIDWRETLGGRKYYGISVLIGEDGNLIGRYNKIFLIPFGEYIPGGGLFSNYGRWLRRRIANLAEFEPGKEYTVFHLSKEIHFSSSICFDAFSPQIIPEMVRNGAELVINLSNLAWFGKTNASRHIEMTLRWKAIENRVPVLYSSNSGRTLFINSLGKNMTENLDLFETGSLSKTVVLQRHFSFYREHGKEVHLAFLALFLLALLCGHIRGKIFSAH
jgi:apolipoprotein N-acyltransferase